MRSVQATLLVKAVIAVGLFELILPAVGTVPPMPALWLGAVVAGMTFLVGDRLILPRFGTALAVAADFAVAVAVLVLLARLTPGVRLSFGGALTAAGALTIAEILFHQYLVQKGVGIR